VTDSGCDGESSGDGVTRCDDLVRCYSWCCSLSIFYV